jgi:hypothetical protein
MSIMPEGGWVDPPKQDAQPTRDSVEHSQDATPLQPRYRSGNPTCKVCDKGSLRLKKLHRMSGPVVAIGVILLVPSVFGMLFCAVMLLAFNTSVGPALGVNANGSGQPYQSAEDAKFRKSCKEGFIGANSQLPGISAPQFCECALSVYKETGSIEGASRTCADRGLDGTLEQPSQDVDALYSSDTSNATKAGLITAVTVFGNAFFLGWGIAFFVSGLLGWLLVMRKRVLQCDFCGAVVNAS